MFLKNFSNLGIPKFYNNGTKRNLPTSTFRISRCLAVEKTGEANALRRSTRDKNIRGKKARKSGFFLDSIKKL